MWRSRSARFENKRREKAVEYLAQRRPNKKPAAHANRSFVRRPAEAASSRYWSLRSIRLPESSTQAAAAIQMKGRFFVFSMYMSKQLHCARMQTAMDAVADARSTAIDTAIYLLFICWLSQSGRDCIDKSRPHVLQRMSRTSRHISIGSPAVDSCATKGRGGLAGNPLPEFIKLSARLWHVSDCVYRSAAWGDDDEVGYCDGVGSGLCECQL